MATPEVAVARCVGRRWLVVGVVALAVEVLVWWRWPGWYFEVAGLHWWALLLAAHRYGWARGYTAGQRG